LIRILSAGALIVFTAVGAQAGTLQNGTWTPNCPPAPGDAPTLSSKSPDAYNKSAKAAQEWQAGAKAYVDCVNSEAKADQSTLIAGANGVVTKINDQFTALKASGDAALEALKKKK
jgi:hypothetical protein